MKIEVVIVISVLAVVVAILLKQKYDTTYNQEKWEVLTLPTTCGLYKNWQNNFTWCPKDGNCSNGEWCQPGNPLPTM